MAASRSSQRSQQRGAKQAPTKRVASAGDGLVSLPEQLANRIIKPLGLVVLSHERLRETLDEAAEQGRITRRDAEELFLTLVRLGREQADDLLRDLERIVGRGRQQLDSATKRARGSEPLDRLVRGADRARRTMGIGPSFPISGYDELTSNQVQQRLDGLSARDLREIRDYERRHANRKSVLNAIEKALS